MTHAIATLLLGPLLLVQGHRARRRVVRLPEPPGARVGSVGEGPALRLLILGDSAGAGVGATHQDEALLGQTVSRLARRYRVEWTLRARTGARSADLLRELDTFEPGSFDVAITTMGVNDVTGNVGLQAWRHRQRELRRRLGSELGVPHVVVCGLPPMRGFPALPQPLRWYLGRRALQFSEALERDVANEPGARYLSLEFCKDARLMAEDGFHPGPAIYEGWGQLASAAIESTVGSG